MFKFEPVDVDQVIKTIKQSPDKTCLLDPIPTTLLKDCLAETAPVITTIFNRSLVEGIVPSLFKEAVVTPLIKKPTGGTSFSNYRPVSNLPFISKVLERIVLQQLNKHCDKFNLQDPCQSAYRKGHSTETALLKIFDDLLFGMDNQRVSILTLLDLSAAFDTVNHAILVKRLETLYGICGTENKWFQSYLSERHQRVKVGNYLSQAKTLLTGVPQGSGLGPWEYTSYTRELGCIMLALSIIYHIFADDTQLQKAMDVNSVASQFQAKESTEQCIKEISNWMNTNKLKLNGEKTEVILIGTQHQLRKVTFSSLTIDGTQIPTVSTVKNLGVFIDSDLKMRSQINSVVRVCYRHIHLLRKMKNYVNKQALHTLIQAFVISRLDYANSL